MIVNFKNKELKMFFLDGNRAKVQQSHVKKLQAILTELNIITNISDMNFPGSGLHRLHGEKEGFWAVRINGNWRVIFRFENENVYDVDYLDYH